jgi:hypothetical protein
MRAYARLVTALSNDNEEAYGLWQRAADTGMDGEDARDTITSLVDGLELVKE